MINGLLCSMHFYVMLISIPIIFKIVVLSWPDSSPELCPSDYKRYMISRRLGELSDLIT